MALSITSLVAEDAAGRGSRRGRFFFLFLLRGGRGSGERTSENFRERNEKKKAKQAAVGGRMVVLMFLKRLSGISWLDHSPRLRRASV